MAGLAVLTQTELLLILVGGLYVAVTGSVMLQVSWFKLTRRTTGWAGGSSEWRPSSITSNYSVGSR